MLPVLRHVHLQLTKRCNLRCYFCGQWGEKGYLRKHAQIKDEADLAEWCRIIAQLATLFPIPRITIWGGEPFLNPDCPAILTELHQRGFQIDLITNGVLIEPHLEVINRCVNNLYVSIDGPCEIHEKIRGVRGIFDIIIKNIAKVDRNRVRKIAMTVINENNFRFLPDLPRVLEPAGLTDILLHNLIFLTPEDSQHYSNWLNDTFGAKALGAVAWVQSGRDAYIQELPEMVDEITRRNKAGQYQQNVNFFPKMSRERILSYYCAPEGLLSGKTSDDYCWAPFAHINIDPAGWVQPCVDFHDLSLGNVREQMVIEIFNGSIASLFRSEVVAGRNPACKHCPWRFNTQLLEEK